MISIDYDSDTVTTTRSEWRELEEKASRAPGCYPSLPVKTPEFGRKVNAVMRVISRANGAWDLFYDVLVAVDEPDCTWRFDDGGEELAHHVDVIYWEYIDG